MKKTLLIIGVVFIIVAALAVLYGLFNMYAYHHVLDGSNDLYQRLHSRMITCYIVSAVLGIIGLICIIARIKL